LKNAVANTGHGQVSMQFWRDGAVCELGGVLPVQPTC
jgi:hypothetical protein